MTAEPAASSLVAVLLALIAAVATLGTAYLGAKLRQVHVLVNSQMTAALDRIGELEAKLGLTAGEQIPSAKIVTETTHGDDGGQR